MKKKSLNQFNSSFYNKIISSIKSGSPNILIDGLENLANTLLIADSSQFRNFPTVKICKEVVKIFNTHDINLSSSNSLILMTIVSQCIVNLLDIIGNSHNIIIKENYIQNAKEKINILNNGNYISNETKPILINIIHSFCSLMKSSSKKLDGELDIKIIMDYFQILNTSEQRYAAEALSNFTLNYYESFDPEILSRIVQYIDSENLEIANGMISAFDNILNTVDFVKIPLDISEKFSRIFAKEETYLNESIILRILKLLLRLTYYTQFSEAIIENGLNFHNIFFEYNYTHEFQNIRRTGLKVILSLLPNPDFPMGFWGNVTIVPANASKFSSRIRNLLIELAIEEQNDLDLIFTALAMSLQLSPEDVPEELISIMTFALQNSKLLPFVILLSLTVPNKNQLKESGIVPYLVDIDISSKVKDPIILTWCKQKILILKSFYDNPTSERPAPKSLKSFSQIFDFLNTTNLSSFELQASGYFDRLFDLIQQESKNNKNSSFEDKDFTKIINKLHQLITFVNMPELYDPFEALSTEEIVSGTIIIDIKYKNRIFKHKSFENTSLMVAIEAWYNENVLHVTINDLLNAARHSGLLGEIVSLDNKKSMKFTQLGLLHRAFGTKRYKRFKFKMDGKIFTSNDFLFQSISRNLSSPEYWSIAVPEVELIGIEDELFNEDTKKSSLVVPTDKIPYKSVFDLLYLIQKIKPSANLYFSEFEKTLHQHLMSFFLDISLFSPAIQIIYHYPFLFSFEFRVFVFRIITSDFFSALSFAQKSIFNIHDNYRLRSRRIFNYCNIRRKSLFDDGFLLLKKIASGPLQIDIIFDNEVGFGVGPTKEFLSLFSKEMALKAHNMWRNDNTGVKKNNENTNYAWTKIGLFPKFDASPDLFYVFGILCAKAVNMNTTLPIPISVEFFKLIKNETISLEDIDDDYAKALKTPEGIYGLNFVYPGTDIELIPNGNHIEVNSENYEEFIDCINQFTVGEKLKTIRQRFCEGFETIFQSDVWHLLSAKEWCTLICGDDTSLTMKDLNNYVEISHGYNKNSPQISMLFEIITEFDIQQKSLFLKFITGSEKLPIGGLASLQPQLTIAKRVDTYENNPDDSLPSVMTCTNYFKLPPYSNKEIMKEKIIKAITEGQGSFLLT